MPQILVKGIEITKVKSICDDMIRELAPVLDFPCEYFSVECIEKRALFQYQKDDINNYPFIEVSYFNHVQEIQDQFATVLTRHILKLGYENVDIIFKTVQSSNWYTNGERF